MVGLGNFSNGSYNGANSNDDMDIGDHDMPYNTEPSGNGFGWRFETRLPSSTDAEFEDEVNEVASGDDPDEAFDDPDEAVDNPDEAFDDTDVDLDFDYEDTISADDLLEMAKEKIRELRKGKNDLRKENNILGEGENDLRKENNELNKEKAKLEGEPDDKDARFDFFIKVYSKDPEIASLLKQYDMKYVPAPDPASR
jgi:hypothetical protein